MSEKKSVLETLVEELKESPEGAVELLNAMTNVVRPWESLKNDGQSVMHTYRRLSVMGEEVALIESNAPTWILVVQGESFSEKKVFNTTGASEKAKALLDEELTKRGFILMEPSSD